MPRRESAGILLYAPDPDKPGRYRFLIGHMGGPFHKKKDDGHWTIPKGEPDAGEDPFLTACRELEEETGLQPIHTRNPIDLGEIRQKGGKWVRAWALPGRFLDPQPCHSNTFPMEWPPKSGRFIDVPELDRLLWADLETAQAKLRPAQFPFIERLLDHLQSAPGSPESPGKSE